MKLKLEFRGHAFDVFAIVLDNGSCPYEDFRTLLKRNNLASHKALANTLRQHAEGGRILNKTKSRQIKHHRNLWEFKTKQGHRLLYFYMPQRRTVLVQGFHKSKPGEAEAEFARAAKIRDAYLAGGG